MSSAENHERYMRMAIDLACSEIGRKEGRPFGAVIVKDGKVLGSGSNRAIFDNDPTAHAEIVAIRDACRKLQTYRLDGSVMYSSCEPCPMCLSAMYWAGIKELYFGTSSQIADHYGFGDRLLYGELCKPAESRELKAVQLLENEALAAFEAWVKAGGTVASVTDWK